MIKLRISIAIIFAIFPSSIFCELNDNDDDDIDNSIDLTQLGSKLYGKPVEVVGGDEMGENPEEFGPYLQGDLLIPSTHHHHHTKSGIKSDSLKWKNGEVPFEIRGSFNAFEMDLIEKALNEYHKNTCIKFTPRRGRDRDYISIQNGNSGCWSSVGRVGGQQIVNLQTPGCVKKVGTLIHELSHAIGFLHEQNREDRDSFIKVVKSNIKKDFENNFDKAKKGETSTFGIVYDYGSVMHYSPTAFSKNGQKTIEVKQKTNEKLGQREGFSKKDIEKVNKMYKCKQPTGTAPDMTTTIKPSIIGAIIGSFFPKSDSDQEEMINE